MGGGGIRRFTQIFFGRGSLGYWEEVEEWEGWEGFSFWGARDMLLLENPMRILMSRAGGAGRHENWDSGKGRKGPKGPKGQEGCVRAGIAVGQQAIAELRKGARNPAGLFPGAGQSGRRHFAKGKCP